MITWTKTDFLFALGRLSPRADGVFPGTESCREKIGPVMVLPGPDNQATKRERAVKKFYFRIKPSCHASGVTPPKHENRHVGLGTYFRTKGGMKDG